MALSADDVATLASLRAARAAIIAGQKPNKVQKDGRLVEFGAGDVARLEADIAALEAADLRPDGRIRRRGALRFMVR